MQTMAMPQRDNFIEKIRRIEGLMAYAKVHKDWDAFEKLKERLKAVIDKMP